MALSRNQHATQSSATAFGTGGYTTGAFTPRDNSLLVIVATANGATNNGLRGTDLTIGDSLGTLSWTSRVATTEGPAASQAIRIWTAPIGTGQSMTVTIDAGAFDVYQYRVVPLDYTGYDTTTSTGGKITGSDADGAGAASITLDAAPASSDETIGVAVIETNTGGVTEGAGWTELVDQVTTGWWGMQLQVRTGSTSTSVDWADLDATAGGASQGILAALVVNAIKAPVITQQPGSQTVREGDAAVFAVEAVTSGGALGYDWEVDSGGGFANAPGTQTNVTYTTGMLTTADDGKVYRCNVTDSNGTTTTASATLKVKPLTYASLGAFDRHLRPEAWF